MKSTRRDHMRYFRSKKSVFLLTPLIVFLYFSLLHHFQDFPISLFQEYISPKEEFRQEIKEHPNYKQEGLNFKPTHPSLPPYNTTVLKQLKKLFPYDAKSPIPKQVWEMYKVPLDHKDFPEEFRKYHETWTKLSPEYHHNIKTNKEMDALVAEIYAGIPDIVHAYNIMPHFMQKCDFGKYLILFAYGGIYNDFDTKLLKPIGSWISSQSEYMGKLLDLGFVTGIESDFVHFKGNYARRVQFCTWNIMSKKGHPLLAGLINEVTRETLRREKAGELNTIIGDNAQLNILDWAGPGRYTDYVFKHLNNIIQDDFDNYESLIDYDFMDQVKAPIVIGDIMVFSVHSFHPGMSFLNSGKLDGPLAYVQHLGAGTWKGKGKGEVSPEKLE